tara:strand:- start:3830 stop:5725 length:1896 start_codon:yes stop_codon:yes gene_type:complete
MTAQKSILQNAYETTLALAIGADATEVAVQVNAAPVGSPSASNPMYLVIDPDSDATREYVKVTSRSGVSLTVVRNIDSDSGGLNAHAVGAKVRMVAMKQHFDDLNDRVDTIMNADGTAVNTSGLVKDEDSMSSNSDTHLATQQSIKAYVDNQVTAQDLDFQADSGGALNIDLDSETLTIAGGTGIDTTGSGNQVSVDIDSTVTTNSGSQSLTNKTIDVDNNTVSNIEVDNLKSGVLDTDLSSVSASDDTIPSAKATKAYVDAQVDTKDTLAELDDVTITSVADNEVVAYDNSSSKFINQTAAEAGLATSAQGALADSATQPSDNISTLTNDSGFITASTTDTLTNKTIDADGTGNSITNIEDANIKSAAAIDASKIADGSVSNAEFQRLDGVTSDIQTQLDGKQASGSYITASSSDTLTNKTFDVEGTGNSISNIDVADFKAAAVVTEAEGIGSNDNDTTLPTSAAVKDYVDSNAGSVTASSTTTFTNKTIDANGTGNNISNIDIGNMTSAVIVTESEGIGSNDNDTTLPTSAAVVDYVANNAGSSNALVASDSDFTLTDGVASGIHYELDNTDMADWNQGGVALTAAGGMFRHNQTQSATFTVAATEGTVLAGPITITGTVTNAGTMVIL